MTNGMQDGPGEVDELRVHMAEAGLARRRRESTQDRFLGTYRARMGFRGAPLRPPSIEGVEGAVDIHCHAHEGQQDALAVAKLASAAGMGGLLFKSIVGMNRPDAPTAAAAVRGVERALGEWAEETETEPVRVWSGWIATDLRGATVPEAAKANLADGVSAVWMPVFRSANTLNKVGGPLAWWGESDDPKAWSDPLPWEKALRVGTYTLDDHGRLKPEYREVFAMIADHDVLVSLAHGTHDEIYAMADEVRDRGITKAVIDHPFSPFIDLSLDQMKELAAAGIHLNFTYDEISPLLGVDPARMAATIAELPLDRVTLSSDAGEPLFPNTVEALRLLHAHMRAFGMSAEQVRIAGSVNPERLMV